MTAPASIDFDGTSVPAARRRPTLLYALGLSLVGAATVASFGLARARIRAEAAEQHSRVTALSVGPLVDVARVSEAPHERTVTLSGEVRAYRQTTLYAKVSGYVRMVRVDRGAKVKSGEVLGVIEAPELEQQVASKRADVAIKQLTEARDQLLAPRGLVSQQQLEHSEAEVNMASADLSVLQTLRGYQVIRAPFAGEITARYADPGALLQAATGSQSALPLVNVADVSRVRVFVYLGQADALFAREGNAATVWTDERPDAKRKGVITRMTRELDVRTRTMLAEVELDNQDDLFYPGTFVRVSLALPASRALLVPEDALLFRSGKSALAVVRDGRVHVTPVEIGDADGKTVRVLGGAQAGDVVVARPSDDVVEGGVVRVRDAKTGT